MIDEELYKVAKEITIPLGFKVEGTDLDMAEAIFVRGAKWMQNKLSKV